MTGYPLLYEWTGEAMVPVPGFRKRADEQFYVGARYRLEVREDRSPASHNHQFAWLAEAWKQLPESIAHLYPTPEHLRARALIEAGYYTEQVIDAGSNAAALRVAAYIRSRQEFALVIVRGPAVAVREPKSQSRRAMDKAEFQASKEAIMQVVAGLIGTTADALRQNAGRAA